MDFMRTEMLGKVTRISRREFLGKSAGLAMAGVVGSNSQNVKSQGSQARRRELVKWRTHDVAKIPSGYQVAVADVNGDGRLDILALSSEESVVEWYENPGWKARSITTRTKKNISLAPLVWKGYAGHGIALASDFYLEDSSRGGSLWWLRPEPSLDSEWEQNLIGRIPTSHRMRWGDFDGDGRPELLDVPLLGAGASAPDYSVGAPITMLRPPETVWQNAAGASGEMPPWSSQLIDNTLTIVHGVRVIDWDGDGRDEFLTASREGVNLFRATGRGASLRWSKTRLPGTWRKLALRQGSSEVGFGMIFGRKFLATIEPWHGDQLAVYFEDDKAGEWKRQVIDSSFHDGHALACADLDGDGNDEIVAGFRGKGTSLHVYYARDEAGRKWERQTLDTEMAAAGVVIGDVNGDGRLDVVSVGASTGNVKWYENAG